MNRNQYELYHHGVKGMKWGVRKDRDKHVRKSAKTKAFERLAKSGQKNAAKQDALYKKTGNEYHKKSADQWRKESAENSKNAKESYEYDTWRAKTPKKDRKAYEQAVSDYNNRVRKGWIDNYNNASTIIDRDITPKYNKMLDDEGLSGKNFVENMKDPIKKARYDEIFEAYNTEAGKRRTELFLEEFGEAPSWRTWKTTKPDPRTTTVKTV